MLAEEVDYVIGVDTHKDAHTAALVNAMGGVVAGVEVAASDSGYRRLLRLALVQAAGRRAWAVEGTGSYGAGLTSFLQRHGERVIEVERPRRPSRKPGKSDQLDALRAARESIGCGKVSPATKAWLARGAANPARNSGRGPEGANAGTLPAACTRGWGRKSFAVASATSLPTSWCADLHGCAGILGTASSFRSRARYCARWRGERRCCGQRRPPVSRSWLDWFMSSLPFSKPSRESVPSAPARSSVPGPTVGVSAPIPASSGQVVRHRLNRGGDRQLNRAFHTIALWRMHHHSESHDYLVKRRAEGKSDREIRRCLKRHLARRLFKLLQRVDSP